MGILVWVMMAIAIWHFTIFLPDRFWGGIVGVFLWCVIGAVGFGLIVHAGGVPNNDELDLMVALEAVPGTLIGLGLCWLIGVRREGARPRGDAFGSTT